MANSSHIDLDLVDLALQAARTNLERALSQRLAVDEEITQWELKIESLENIAAHRSANGVENVNVIGSEFCTPTGRIPHGHSEQLIIRFLHTRNDSGATIREMANATRVKYPTAHRLIQILKQRGRVKKDENSSCWRLVK